MWGGPWADDVQWGHPWGVRPQTHRARNNVRSTEIYRAENNDPYGVSIRVGLIHKF